jgi:hypothetical protein
MPAFDMIQHKLKNSKNSSKDGVSTYKEKIENSERN